jgi:hypothetical protein
MRALVYTTRRWVVSTRRMFQGLKKEFPDLTVDVLTSPPKNADTFPYEMLSLYDVLYFRLHGLEKQPYLYGASFRRYFGETAFSLEAFKFHHPDLTGVKAFLEGCYQVQTGIPDALVCAGAEVVASTGSQTFNGKFRVGPAGEIGRSVLRAWLREERDVKPALEAAVGEYRGTKYEMEFVAMRPAKPGEFVAAV